MGRFNLVWSVCSAEQTAQRLNHMKPSAALDPAARYGHLCIWREDQRPRLVAWLALDEQIEAAIAREGAGSALSLSRWLEGQSRIDLGAVALGWTCYWQHLAQGGSNAWAAHLRRPFESDPMLDQALAMSRGWLLWDHQLQLLADLSIAGEMAPKALAHELRSKVEHAIDWVKQARLPDGRALESVIKERSYPLAHPTCRLESQIVAKLYSFVTRHYDPPTSLACKTGHEPCREEKRR